MISVKYFSEVESVTSKKRSRWNPDEDRILAQLEIKHPAVKFRNEYIFNAGNLPNITQDSIKSRRKDQGYEALLKHK